MPILSPEIVELYKRSLLIVHTQIDRDGAILAANDSDVTERATDHYSYLWTRDGAFVANALDLAGYRDITRKFFDFCSEIVHDKGYFLQKYNPDGTVASGWHAAWDKYSGNAQTADSGRRNRARYLGSVAALRQIPRHRICASVVSQTGYALCRFYGRISPRRNKFARAELESVGRPPRNSHFYLRIGCRRTACGGKFCAAFRRSRTRRQHTKRRLMKSSKRCANIFTARNLADFCAPCSFTATIITKPTRRSTLRFSAHFISARFPPDDEMVENTMKAIEKHLWIHNEDRRRDAF